MSLAVQDPQVISPAKFLHITEIVPSIRGQVILGSTRSEGFNDAGLQRIREVAL